MAAVGDDDEARARALWDAYARGDVDAVRAQLDDEVQWRPLGGEVLHGPAEVAAYLRDSAERTSAVAHVFETEGDYVIRPRQSAPLSRRRLRRRAAHVGPPLPRRPPRQHRHL